MENNYWVKTIHNNKGYIINYSDSYGNYWDETYKIKCPFDNNILLPTVIKQLDMKNKNIAITKTTNKISYKLI